MKRTIETCDRCKEELKIFEIEVQQTEKMMTVDLCTDCILLELRLVVASMTLENQDKWRQRVVRVNSPSGGGDKT